MRPHFKKKKRMNASEVAARYLRFAETEARVRSPLSAAIFRGVASDRDVLDFLLTFPREKQQPNLLLAAVRHLFDTPADWKDFAPHCSRTAMRSPR